MWRHCIQPDLLKSCGFCSKGAKNPRGGKLVGAAGDLTLMENDLRDADEALAAELRKSEHRHLQLLWYWMGCVLDIRQMLLRQSV